MAFEIEIPLQPKQAELLRLVEESPATWVGYGGSRGSAKSHGARAVMLLRRLKYKGSRGLIFRRTFEQLWENHIQPLFAQYPFMRAWYHTQHKELTLPNGSVIVFGYAEHRGDIDSFQGKSFMDIAPDEATHLTEKELIFLQTCNRWPGMPDRKCKMILTCNPGNVGHAFIKRIFITREYHENEHPEDYAFLQARAWDNVEWARSALAEAGLSDRDYYSWNDEERFRFFINRTDYGGKLNSLPAALRVGNLLGDWTQYAGLYFDIFNPARHVKQVGRIEPWYPRWVSIDWGFDHPSAVYWHTTMEDGRHHTYREFVQSNLTPRMLAGAIRDRSIFYDNAGNKQPEPIQWIYASPDADHRRDSDDTVLIHLGDAFVEAGLPRPIKADTDRVGGWMLMYQLLQSEYWTIDPSCVKLIECLPSLTRDEDNSEDILKVDGDDPADSVRYGLKGRVSAPQAPLEVRVMAHPLSENLTIRAMQIRRFTIEEERKTESKPWYPPQRNVRSWKPF